MREIKFRVWNSVMKETLTVVGDIRFSTDDGVTHISAGKTQDWLKDGWTDIEKEDMDKVEIMQYTGLKDKNGKEIYEGDVITCYAVQREVHDVIEEDTKVVVEYHSGYFYPFCYNAGWRSEVGNIEVIGNIYENPELLTDTKV